MRGQLPLVAVLAVEVALGEQAMRMRIRARIEQLSMLLTGALVVAMIAGYQIGTRQRQMRAVRDRLTGAPGANRPLPGS